MIYMLGIFMYKFGLEAFNGSISTLAQDRFKANRTFTKWGALSGLNQAMQCVGSILIAPLIRKYATRSVLASAILVFGLITAILLIVDAGTGGKIKSNGKIHYGRYNPDVLFPIYMATGIAYGMVELIRRVIPRDIVGGDPSKLKRMDAMVHVLYEVAGTSGAFASAALITKLGNNYAFMVTPIFFTLASLIWSRITPLNFQAPKKLDSEKSSYLRQILHGTKHFGQAVYTGAFIVFSHRRFCWLVPGYSFALYGHRYFENGVAPLIAKRILNVSTYSQIMVGGSNFGELLGALSVFFAADKVQTPIPFIRLDALLINVLWALPYLGYTKGRVADAWRVAGIFTPLSFGWAAGDVSLAAYIQSSLAKMESTTEGISALGAVMAFLYVVYIVINAILSSVLGAYIDREWNSKKDALTPLRNVAGIQGTVLCVIILLATLIPRGALALNPKLPADEQYNDEEDLKKVSTEEKTSGSSEEDVAHAKRKSAEVEMFVPA